MLIERFGSVAAYWIMAGGLAVVGVLAAVLVSAKKQDEELADKQAEESDTAAVATDAAAQAAAQAPLVLVGSLLTAPSAPAMAFSVARALPGPGLGLGASARSHRDSLLAARESECSWRRKHRRS
jgi:hypothetical protein